MPVNLCPANACLAFLTQDSLFVGSVSIWEEHDVHTPDRHLEKEVFLK